VLVELSLQNERFRDAVLFAKMIIERATIYNKDRSASSFSFLFQMNMLFERYIEAALKEAVGHNEVVSQHAEKDCFETKKAATANFIKT
jgi:5-methylcytosine-specific restriction enzyme subunit McrC